MAHLHEVREMDTHFVIDPITRVITNPNSAKNKLMQGDHNSEIYTFEIPRMVEGHDMSFCSQIRIHYNDVASDKANESKDVYTVNNMQIDMVETDKISFSWLISGNATKYAGLLSFRIQFLCFDESGSITYKWHTEIFKGITVSDGFENAEAVVEQYSDVLEAWKKELESLTADEAIESAVEEWMAANPVEHPEALPNPNALTITGAVEATYDGSSPVSVEIPKGGGEWKMIANVTIEEEVQNVMFTRDVDGNPFALTEEIMLCAKLLPNTEAKTSGYTTLHTYSGTKDIYGSGLIRSNAGKGVPATGQYCIYRYYKFNGAKNTFMPITIMEAANTYVDYTNTHGADIFEAPGTKQVIPVDKLEFKAYANMGVGSTIQIYGR